MISVVRVISPVLLFLAAAADADRPAPQRDYTCMSPNGQFEFQMEASYPPGGAAYNTSHQTRLWTVEGWYSHKTFLADDGRHLVRMGSWASLPPEEALAVAFYRDGLEIARYVVAELVEDTSLVERSVSHYRWQGLHGDYPRLIDETRFQLLTVEDTIVTFDAATGAILGLESRGEPTS